MPEPSPESAPASPSVDPARASTLTPETAAEIAAGIVTPIDEWGAARAHCTVDAEGHRVYFALDGGRKRSEPVGPAFASPRDAVMLAAALDARIRRRGLGNRLPPLPPKRSEPPAEPAAGA